MINIHNFSKIIVANWKLNGSLSFLNEYTHILSTIELKKDVCGVICPPSIYLQALYEEIKNTQFYLGAQETSNHEKGPYTGEISAKMLKDIKSQFCIIGHSESRQNFHQSNADIKKKVNELINNNINYKKSY